MKPLLEITDLHVRVDGKTILNGVTLTVNSGEVHALMGPNGSGKSTLAHVIMGHPKYQVTGGDIRFMGKSLLKCDVRDRALRGLFMAFQYPKEIQGVTLEEFLLAIYRAKRKHDDPDKPPVLVFRFQKILKGLMESLQMDEKFSGRYLNHGFSGGEKKKAEILQMALLKPMMAVLDETDSGLDVDALKTVTDGIKAIQKDSPKMGVLLVTHYQHVLKHLKPDRVHVLKKGRLVKSGGRALARELEKSGYVYL